MRHRKLSLKKETLAELVSEDLRAVAGGASAGPTCYSCLTACALCDTVIVDMLLSPVTGRICPGTMETC